MTFNSMYNSSISLQNAILKILSNQDAPEPIDIIDEIHEDHEESVTANTKLESDKLDDYDVDDNPNKVLSATEIIYRAMLNDYEKDTNVDLKGGNNAENMILNIIKGGNKSSSDHPKQDVFDEILESTKEKQFDQQNGISGGNKHTSFINALNKYKSITDAVDDITSSSHNSDTSDDDVDENEETNLSDTPKGFVPVNAHGTNFMSQKKQDDEDESSNDESTSNGDESSSTDEFVFPEDGVNFKANKDVNTKYIRLIKQFKNPAKKDSHTILGGSVDRPKTVTIINAFPYIIKSNPSS